MLLLWMGLFIFYILSGIAYLYFSPFPPLGAMINDDIISNLGNISLAGMLSVSLGYLFVSLSTSSCDAKAMKMNEPFIFFSSILFLIVGVSIFIVGVSYYGGYISFLNTPYSPIYEGSAENKIQDTLISSSGLLLIFSIISCLSTKQHGFAIKAIIITICLWGLISIFYQGRRENILLLFMCIIFHKIFIGEISLKKLFKLLSLCSLLLLIAGLGLYLRENNTTSGGSILSATLFAIMFETHFTLATLANEMYTHTLHGISYAGFSSLFEPFLFMLPSFIFGVFGFSKQVFFYNSEPKFYDDKGGAFIFTEAFHSYGYLGVFFHGVILGILLGFFYRMAKRTQMIIFQFPLVCLTFVAVRKDITYGMKYVSLMLLFMLLFYLIYCILPKKRIIKL